MAVKERDPFTGYMTTGHEWSGITELNTPVPRAVYLFLIAAVAFSLIGWVLWPAWPIGTTYTKGLLGSDQGKAVLASLEEGALSRAEWSKAIESKSFAEIEADPRLMAIVRTSGHRLFGDHCAACHRADARGQRGFPNLTTSSWLWGGDPETIAETIRVGINSEHPQSRVAQMPAFGQSGLLPHGDIEKVAAYVRSLSEPAVAKTEPPATLATGKDIFAANCALCHGEDATGKTEVGAPNLADKFWIYGGDAQSVLTTIEGGRQGHMPTWEARLSPLARKILALYVVGLRAPDQ
jgi:cytochrome c oxidase cbb3-type subunit 3